MAYSVPDSDGAEGNIKADSRRLLQEVGATAVLAAVLLAGIAISSHQAIRARNKNKFSCGNKPIML